MYRCGCKISPYTSLLELPDILWVKDRYLSQAYERLHLDIKSDPVKTTMFGIWVNFENRTSIPAFFISKLLIQINFDLRTRTSPR